MRLALRYDNFLHVSRTYPKEGIRKTDQGHLALPAQKRLEKNTQSVKARKAFTPSPNAYVGTVVIGTI